ncbi:PepSY-associated TM helix domain-containing protein [Thalassomonas actiniarum]|uniref:PepSY domain-containing protein n=1 Tax=Thalassomonas actiniarum TaxID=485447 RepID=A0AAF0C4T0_9GAMM|nr:PepSY-associated TM helix domain-containing protein [Thalassomonas actiniarum]WDE00314.1 PepSY domain-containing protein [Thalassomonas actiniarum]
MKPDFRRTMIWLHTYTGLLLGWLLFAIFLTGTLSYFNDEISQWMQPELGVGQQHENIINTSLARLKAQGTDVDKWWIDLPGQRNNQWRLQWQKGKERQSLYLEGESGEQVTPRATQGGNFFRTFHYTLELRNYGGRYIAGIAAMFMLLALFSGIFTHRRFFRDFFTLRKKTLLKTLTDFHALAGIVTIPFCLVICASALIIYIGLYMPWSAQHYLDGGTRELNQKVTTYLPELEPGSAYREPLTDFSVIAGQVAKLWRENPNINRITVEQPFAANGRIIVERTRKLSLSNKSEVLVFSSHSGQQLAGMPPERMARKIRRIFYGLHEGHFAQPGLRWLFFISGLLSSALIASGLVIWLYKRLEKTKQRHAGHFIVERLNIAGIAGLVLAIIGYFYANRLLPVDIDERARLEIVAFLFIWLISLQHSVFRPVNKAWLEQLSLASLACLLLPVIDVSQDPSRLTQAIEQHNLIYLGFELALLVTGLLLYKTVKALLVKQKQGKEGKKIVAIKRINTGRIADVV